MVSVFEVKLALQIERKMMIYECSGSVLRGAPPEGDASLPFWFCCFWRGRLFATIESLTSSTSKLSVLLRFLLLLLCQYMSWFYPNVVHIRKKLMRDVC